MIQAAPDARRGDYRGPVTHVILDWAGTIVDFGSFAPTQIFVDAFAAFGVAVTLEEARGPMGLAKIEHIRALGRTPRIAQAWARHRGAAFSDEDARRIYEVFLPMQIERVARYSAPIPGAFEAIASIRRRGVKIGSCSGYPATVMAKVLERAARDGFAPDHCVASDALPQGGRPMATMAWANAIALSAAHAAACVKVDDTAPGIEEGRRAGMWSVGVALSGNEAGWTADEFQRAGDVERSRRRAAASERLFAAGAHYVIDTTGELPAVIEAIDRRLALGERP